MPNTTITIELDDDEYAYLVNALAEYRDSYTAKEQEASEAGMSDLWSSAEVEAIEEPTAKIEQTVEDAWPSPGKGMKPTKLGAVPTDQRSACLGRMGSCGRDHFLHC